MIKNTLSICVILLAASAGAQAAGKTGYRCTENGSGPDNGYIVYISKNRSRAVVQEESLAGPQTLGTLTCSPVLSGLKPGNDVPNTILTCSEPHLADSGFTVNVKAGGFTGLITAELNQQSIAGPKLLAQMTCKAQ